ncbi:amidase [Actinomadura soli]|uniref:Amidase n=1 Tax=Actinomadura soli TaxID=2508997 RepID=A0A5C4JK21_9ACTN|nr:amidase family protein [Actinomadura soli]TMR05696.1 amidase [Actinomadura soli]
MFVPPTPAEVQKIARRFGLHLDDQDALAYAGTLTDQLAALEDFAQERMEEETPPLLFPERGPGHRPSRREDRYNAWLWRCEIGGGDGLLAGKTVSFKDHVAVAGIPLTFGTATLEGFRPDFDATVVTRVLAAGGVVAGKNTHHGFAGLRSVGGGLGDYWDAVNPHDPTRQTGGSSSGSAVAVATGDVDISFGGDQGGSIRHPAAYCGVVGHKPTFGLVSHMGIAYGGEPSIDHIGPLARTVEDAALALQAVAGYDGYDPRQGRDVPDTLDVLSGLRDGVSGLRVGVLREGFAEPIDPRVRHGVTRALDLLRAAGAKVVEVSAPEHGTVHAAAGALQLEGFRMIRETGIFGGGARGYYPRSITSAVGRMWQADGDRLAAYLKMSWILGELSRRRFHGAVYAKAQNVRPRFIRAYDAALREVDVLAMPTCMTPAPPLPEPPTFEEARRREIDVLKRVVPEFRNLSPFSYTGHPALAVPAGDIDGLPYSVQLVGRCFDDALVLRVGHSLEQLIRWKARPLTQGNDHRKGDRDE